MKASGEGERDHYWPVKAGTWLSLPVILTVNVVKTFWLSVPVSVQQSGSTSSKSEPAAALCYCSELGTSTVFVLAPKLPVRPAEAVPESDSEPDPASDFALTPLIAFWNNLRAQTLPPDQWVVKVLWWAFISSESIYFKVCWRCKNWAKCSDFITQAGENVLDSRQAVTAAVFNRLEVSLNGLSIVVQSMCTKMLLEHLKGLLQGPILSSIFDNSGNNADSQKSLRLYNSYHHCPSDRPAHVFGSRAGPDSSKCTKIVEVGP